MVSRWQVCMSRIYQCFTCKCWQCGVFCTQDPPGVPGVCEVLRSDTYQHSDRAQRDSSARSVGDSGQSLVFPHVSHPPALCIPELETRCLLHIWLPCVAGVSIILSPGAYQHPEGTERDPSARTVGDFSQLLASLHVLHLPVLHMKVLQCSVFCTHSPLK